MIVVLFDLDLVPENFRPVLRTMIAPFMRNNYSTLGYEQARAVKPEEYDMMIFFRLQGEASDYEDAIPAAARKAGKQVMVLDINITDSRWINSLDIPF